MPAKKKGQPHLPAALPITKARQRLCPLVEDLARAADGQVAITVGEEVAAYLVSPARLAELEARASSSSRPSLVGTAVLSGEWEEIEDALHAEARAQEARVLDDLGEGG